MFVCMQYCMLSFSFNKLVNYSLNYFFNVLVKPVRCTNIMGKTIHSQARTLILKVLTFFENEKANKRLFFPVDQAIKRACAATGVSKKTLMNIKKEARILLQNDPTVSGSGLILPTPGTTRRRSAKKIELDDFELNALRNIINDFTGRKKVLTLKNILAAAKREFNFRGGITTLRQILVNNFGYKFKKHKNDHKKAQHCLLDGSPPFKEEIEISECSLPVKEEIEISECSLPVKEGIQISECSVPVKEEIEISECSLPVKEEIEIKREMILE